jgi:hypothetical protein
MPVSTTSADMHKVYYELYRANSTGAVDLKSLVDNSLLDPKTPYDLARFKGYDATPTVTLSLMTGSTDTQTEVLCNFDKNKTCKFNITVYHTIDKQDGLVPAQYSIGMLGVEEGVSSSFIVDRKSSDYQVAVKLDQIENGYFSTAWVYATIPALVSSPTVAYTHGKDDAEADNTREANGEPVVGARPEYWGYYDPSPEYTDYMNGYDTYRMQAA